MLISETYYELESRYNLKIPSGRKYFFLRKWREEDRCWVQILAHCLSIVIFCGHFKPVLCTSKETCCAREAGNEPDSRRATGGADEETAGRGGADEETMKRGGAELREGEARIQQEVGRGKTREKRRKQGKNKYNLLIIEK